MDETFEEDDDDAMLADIATQDGLLPPSSRLNFRP